MKLAKSILMVMAVGIPLHLSTFAIAATATATTAAVSVSESVSNDSIASTPDSVSAESVPSAQYFISDRVFEPKTQNQRSAFGEKATQFRDTLAEREEELRIAKSDAEFLFHNIQALNAALARAKRNYEIATPGKKATYVAAVSVEVITSAIAAGMILKDHYSIPELDPMVFGPNFSKTRKGIGRINLELKGMKLISALAIFGIVAEIVRENVITPEMRINEEQIATLELFVRREKEGLTHLRNMIPILEANILIMRELKEQ
jgi:hypothetical protein